jgi:hypothetical protein
MPLAAAVAARRACGIGITPPADRRTFRSAA